MYTTCIQLRAKDKQAKNDARQQLWFEVAFHKWHPEWLTSHTLNKVRI